MTGITRDLEDDIQAKSNKYAFDFQSGRPLESAVSSESAEF